MEHACNCEKNGMYHAVACGLAFLREAKGRKGSASTQNVVGTAYIDAKPKEMHLAPRMLMDSATLQGPSGFTMLC